MAHGWAPGSQLGDDHTLGRQGPQAAHNDQNLQTQPASGTQTQGQAAKVILPVPVASQGAGRQPVRVAGCTEAFGPEEAGLWPHGART